MHFKNSVKTRWAVGVNNRGHDHFDYAVIIDGIDNEVVVKCDSFDLASHIVLLHNAELEK